MDEIAAASLAWHRSSDERHSSIAPFADGFRNKFLVLVTGKNGKGEFVRNSWADALATLVFYGRLFDAPHSCFDY
jgi:hypothetical protein